MSTEFIYMYKVWELNTNTSYYNTAAQHLISPYSTAGQVVCFCCHQESVWVCLVRESLRKVVCTHEALLSVYSIGSQQQLSSPDQNLREGGIARHLMIDSTVKREAASPWTVSTSQSYSLAMLQSILGALKVDNERMHTYRTENTLKLYCERN